MAQRKLILAILIAFLIPGIVLTAQVVAGADFGQAWTPGIGDLIGFIFLPLFASAVAFCAAFTTMPILLVYYVPVYSIIVILTLRKKYGGQ